MKWCCRTGLNCGPLPYQGSDRPKNSIKSVTVRRDLPCLSAFVHGFHGRFMGGRAAGERCHRMAKLIVRMMTVGVSDDGLGGTQYPATS